MVTLVKRNLIYSYGKGKKMELLDQGLNAIRKLIDYISPRGIATRGVQKAERTGSSVRYMRMRQDVQNQVDMHRYNYKTPQKISPKARQAMEDSRQVTIPISQRLKKETGLSKDQRGYAVENARRSQHLTENNVPISHLTRPPYSKPVVGQAEIMEKNPGIRRMTDAQMKYIDNRRINIGAQKVKRRLRNTALGAAGLAGAAGIYELSQHDNTTYNPALVLDESTHRLYGRQGNTYGAITTDYTPDGTILKASGEVVDKNGNTLRKGDDSRNIFKENAEAAGFTDVQKDGFSKQVATLQEALYNNGLLGKNDIDGYLGNKTLSAYETYKRLGGRQSNGNWLRPTAIQDANPNIPEDRYIRVPRERGNAEIFLYPQQ